MRSRRKIPNRKSKKLFSRTAGFHPKNNAPNPMRGGYRL
ncbi:MAG: hypothetical protein [Microvirus sp.]|nr:MAG: hypothetical protein [Microvirus sp.]